MGRIRKEESLARELAGLSHLSLDELRARWRDLYGTVPSSRISRLMLIGAVAYRMQEQALGGLPLAGKRYLERTAAGAPGAGPARKLKLGTVLLREWQGITHHVTMVDGGVMYQDRRYRSLSAVARQISGIHRSGPDFFGLRHHGKA